MLYTVYAGINKRSFMMLHLKKYSHLDVTSQNYPICVQRRRENARKQGHELC